MLENVHSRSRRENVNQFSFSNHGGVSSYNMPYSEQEDDESVFDKETVDRVKNDSEYQKFELQYNQMKSMFGEAKERMVQEEEYS